MPCKTRLDPDHFDHEISVLKGIIKELQAKDKYLDKQAKQLGTEYDLEYRQYRKVRGQTKDWKDATRSLRDPAFLPRRSRILSGVRRTVRRLPRVRRTKSSRPTVARTIASTTKRPSYIADPSKLVKPIDIPGYDNLNNVRFVPRDDSPGYFPTRGLVEGQIVLPQHQFLKSLEVIEQNPEYSHVELTDEDGDGYIDRFVVRGPKDSSRPKRQNVGLFVDIAKPLKNDRLAMENWVLQ